MGSTHGDRTKAIARKHVVQACAERVVRIVTANVELVPEPALEPGQGPESDETSSVTVLADVNTATREYIAGLQEENRQLREGGSPSARKYRSQSKG
jgi:CelD/BcsL family acetyltransferase involved in cellulose biosynthesis